MAFFWFCSYEKRRNTIQKLYDVEKCIFVMKANQNVLLSDQQSLGMKLKSTGYDISN